MNAITEPLARKILLIDDDPDEQLLLRDALARLHPSFEIQWIDQTCEKPLTGPCNIPDLAFVDINMPGENGFDWVRKLRAHGYTFPIVMFSNSGSEADRQEAYEAGATLYVTKPHDHRQYVETIKSLLFFDLAQLQPPLRHSAPAFYLACRHRATKAPLH